MAQDPVKPGTTVNGMKTPMTSTNIGKQGDSAKIHSYKGMPSTTGGTNIKSPMGATNWKKGK